MLRVVSPCWSSRAYLPQENDRDARSTSFVSAAKNAAVSVRDTSSHNPPVPLTQIVADLQFEMLGRPDPKVPPGTLWLTGFERSTLGPELARQGAALVADPHPEQNFFQRSDNYPLALRGVIAHTISSFGLHTDYHRPSDDVRRSTSLL